MFEWVIRKDIGGRQEQQDDACVLVQDDFLLAAVADGLGGHRGGALASKTVTEQLRAIMQKSTFPLAQPAGWLKKCCLLINQAIIKKGYQKRCEPMTTLVLLLIQKEQAYWLHVGDSRLYYFNKNNKYKRTRDHSQVQKLLELGLITEAEMGNHREQNLILSCLGADSPAKISLDSDSFTKENAFLLCTDGFWEQFTSSEMGNLVFSSNLRETATSAMHRAAKRGGVRGDNLTFAIIRQSAK